MAKVLLICGKIASGKSVYAARLVREKRAVLLSVDEITIGVLGGDLGEQHDAIAERVQQYLFAKSVEIVRAGSSVVLDWGFWTREKRSAARAYYAGRHIECEFHYVDTPQETWLRNIDKRNHEVLSGQTQAYFVDEGLKCKLEAAFETPDRSEIDVWYRNDWQ